MRPDLKSFDMQIQVAERQVKYARALSGRMSDFMPYNGADQNPATVNLVRESLLAGVSPDVSFF